jgi:integrase
MTLTELATTYCNRVGGSAGYLEQLTVLTKRLPWDVSDLTPDLIDQYLTEALKHLAPSTVANHRRMLWTLLRFAAAERLVAASIVRPPRRVKRPPPAPRAWSHAEILHLLRACEKLTGGMKCPHAVLMRAWVLTAYSTGLRLCDLLEIKWDQLRGQRILVRQHKTGQPHVVYVDDNAMRALTTLPKRGPRIFGDLICRDKLLAQMRRLVRIADLPGSTKFLRRSGATYSEVIGHCASAHLGHKTPTMKAHYVDRLLLAEERGDGPSVPPLKMASG